MPLRIEQSMRYGLRGREYRLERRHDGQSLLVYEASDFIQMGDVWIPRVGAQRAYRPKEQGPKELDIDALAEKLLAEGAMRWTGELQLAFSHEWRILSIEPIDPSLNLWFEPQPGAEVVNMETHQRYVQGDEVASQKFAASEHAIEALVGHAAPEFPEGATWLNGQPLTWKALRGKVVILDFWADWCGPCRNDLPRLRQLHDDREKNGLTIIGVHLAGSKLASVKKAVGDFRIAFPVCIDLPNGGKLGKAEPMPFPSTFTSQFAIDSIPHFVVVDRRGSVAASLPNRFQDALAIAQRLAEAND
jgi:thiol-disulfide isomerase/thioredoxin